MKRTDPLAQLPPQPLSLYRWSEAFLGISCSSVELFFFGVLHWRQASFRRWLVSLARFSFCVMAVLAVLWRSLGVRALSRAKQVTVCMGDDNDRKWHLALLTTSFNSFHFIIYYFFRGEHPKCRTFDPTWSSACWSVIDLGWIVVVIREPVKPDALQEPASSCGAPLTFLNLLELLLSVNDFLSEQTVTFSRWHSDIEIVDTLSVLDWNSCGLCRKKHWLCLICYLRQNNYSCNVPTPSYGSADSFIETKKISLFCDYLMCPLDLLAEFVVCVSNTILLLRLDASTLWYLVPTKVPGTTDDLWWDLNRELILWPQWSRVKKLVGSVH